MFERQDSPRIFAVPPGADFPRVLVAGLNQRLAGQAPDVAARTEILLNSGRMRRRVTEAWNDGPAGLLPRLGLVSSPGGALDALGLPPETSSLRRRLELSQAVARLLDAQPDLAPRSALFDLADSLAALAEEMTVEGVLPESVAALSPDDLSGHWQRSLAFLGVLAPFLSAEEQSDPISLQRIQTDRVIARWQASPPQHPVIVAGSTGSRGTTLRLMQAVLDLPQGALVLPGFDMDMPAGVWRDMGDALTAEDHPQYRFAAMLDRFGVAPDAVQPWLPDVAPNPARNRIWSLALRPAPVTHQWRTEGPDLPELPGAMSDVTLVEARSPRDEALAIALRLRSAVEAGETAALITPDRMLTRQVTAALDRWGILPDDSAGIPAQLTAPGRFLRHVAALFSRPLTAEALIELLKHPLCHRGGARGDHLKHVRDLELDIRKNGMPFPDAETLTAWAEKKGRADWVAWLIPLVCAARPDGPRPLVDWVPDLRTRAEALCAGSESDDASELWAEAPGQEVARQMQALADEAPFGGAMSARDFADFLGALLARGEVRDSQKRHPRILIWGTLETRVMGADLLILGGLNEGSWPEAPKPDPWLNRKMRHGAGLLLPERRIGLSAHDFQIGAGAPKVWLTRATRSQDAETVPSRWLNRLVNLFGGLPQRGGPQALKEMRARGLHWLEMARASESPDPIPPAPRPAPCPPVAARPKGLSVTEIKRLIRDPYAIYAKHVLRLRPLQPLQRAPDALIRGIVLHGVFEQFVRDTKQNPGCLTPEHLGAVARQVLQDQVPWPAIRPVWQARIDRVARWFVAQEAARQALTPPGHFEKTGRLTLDGLGFELRGTADRIDIDGQGLARVYDYKTGNPPSPKEQQFFDKQLLLEAAMLERGAFDGLHPKHVVEAVYIGLGTKPVEQAAPLDIAPPAQVWAEFCALIAAYAEPDKAYPARNATFTEQEEGDYDQLSRFGEWDGASPAEKVVLT